MRIQKCKATQGTWKCTLGITIFLNSSVSEQMNLKISKHLYLKSHTRYQRINNEYIEKKYKAINPLLLNDSSNDVTDTNHFKLTTTAPEAKRQQSQFLPPTFDSNDANSPHLHYQVVINIGNFNSRHLSPDFEKNISQSNHPTNIDSMSLQIFYFSDENTSILKPPSGPNLVEIM